MTNLVLDELYDKEGAEFVQAFIDIPASVTSLNLNRNDFGWKTGSELAQAFAGFSQN